MRTSPTIIIHALVVYRPIVSMLQFALNQSKEYILYTLIATAAAASVAFTRIHLTYDWRRTCNHKFHNLFQFFFFFCLHRFLMYTQFVCSRFNSLYNIKFDSLLRFDASDELKPVPQLNESSRNIIIAFFSQHIFGLFVFESNSLASPHHHHHHHVNACLRFHLS